MYRYTPSPAFVEESGRGRESVRVCMCVKGGIRVFFSGKGLHPKMSR